MAAGDIANRSKLIGEAGKDEEHDGPTSEDER
jgi:hypothetical protein